MRCYDGSPDAHLQARLDAQEAAKARLAERGLRAVWFPLEGAWMVIRDNTPVSGFWSTIEQAEAGTPMEA